MKCSSARRHFTRAIASLIAVLSVSSAAGQDPPPSSYSPVVEKETFEAVVKRMTAEKPEIAARHQKLLQDRYDLADQTADGIAMSRGKPIQSGVRVKLPRGLTWEQLAEMTPGQIKDRDLWPAGFYPLPHPNHPEGGMLFPRAPHR
jgi:hypothetical protein